MRLFLYGKAEPCSVRAWICVIDSGGMTVRQGMLVGGVVGGRSSVINTVAWMGGVI